jgi:hypothetical protein
VTLTAADVTAPVARYAQRLHAVAGTRHHVASPLGAWLLLALCAPAGEGDAARGLRDALGCDPADAAGLASDLLASPHPLVPAAAAAWHRPGSVTAAAARWLDGLPAHVQTGPLPGQAQADEWARRHTLGLIERFPVGVSRSLSLLAATVLATRVSWQKPFEVVPAAELGPGSPWAGRLSEVLRTPDGHEHEQFIASAGLAGDVAVHTARAAGGLAVTSVAAAPDVAPLQVIAAAYSLATALAAGDEVARRSLFDLPLGDGPAWTITERATTVRAPGGREQRCAAVLPAWSASSEFDLADPRLGFDIVARSLAPGDPWQAIQAAVARYSRTGFEAAAVSAMMVALGVPVRRPGLLRVADLRFGHPYAVVAVTTDSGPWHGLPVFSAWVAEPENAEKE